MARQIKETLVDDIDGSEAAETVAFGVDGTAYEMELNEKNAKKLRAALAPFVAQARKSASAGTPRRRTGRQGSSALDRQKSAEIRLWAKGQGIMVSERGRISANVVEKFEAAH